MTAPRPAALPGALPEGERVLWQGAPDWKALASGALHVRKIALYFAVLLAWYVASSLQDGAAARDVALGTLRFVAVALVPLVLLSGYAYLAGRMTAYTITTRRVVLRFGVVLPMSVNLPFSRIEAADLKLAADGTGDIAMRLAPTRERLSWVVLWPNARPWRFGRAEPALRAVPQAAMVAQVLARALAASAQAPAPLQADAAPAARRGGPAAATA